MRIVAVGKVKESYLNQGIAEYLKRLGPYARMEVLEVADEPIPERASGAQEGAVMAREGDRILSQIKEGSYVIALTPEGRMFPSEGLAKLIGDLGLQGRSHITWIIGGSLGLDKRILDRADLRFSLSPMTFLHQMTRLILLEQIYRGFKILRGETYHK